MSSKKRAENYDLVGEFRGCVRGFAKRRAKVRTGCVGAGKVCGRPLLNEHRLSWVIMGRDIYIGVRK